MIAKLVCIFCLLTVVALGAQQKSNSFRVAFPLDSLKDVAASDVKVAADFLLRDIVEAQGFESVVSTPASHEVLMEEILEDRYDAFVIFTYQYLKYRDQYQMVPQVAASHEGKDARQSLLLLLRDGCRLEDLKDGKLLIQSGLGSTVNVWLESELRKQGLKREELFSEISVEENISKTLLPLFFGKTDAAICMSKSFDLMTELNPQIAKKLIVHEKSEPLLSTMICLSGSFTERKPGTLKKVALNLNKSTQGSQLLTMMGVERFVAFNPADLAGVQRLIEVENREKGLLKH